MTALLSDRIPLGDAELSRLEYDEHQQIRAIEAEDSAGKVIRIEFPPVTAEAFDVLGPQLTLTTTPRPRIEISLRQQ